MTRIIFISLGLVVIGLMVIAALGVRPAQANNGNGNPNPHKYTATPTATNTNTPDIGGTATASYLATQQYYSTLAGTLTQMVYDATGTAQVNETITAGPTAFPTRTPTMTSTP